MSNKNHRNCLEKIIILGWLSFGALLGCTDCERFTGTTRHLDLTNLKLEGVYNEPKPAPNNISTKLVLIDSTKALLQVTNNDTLYEFTYELSPEGSSEVTDRTYE